MRLRDWSLITGKGVYKMGKIAGLKLFAPPPPLKTGGNFLCPPPLFKGWKLVGPPITMAKTSSSRVETTPKVVMPPFSMAKTCYAPPPPFCRGETSLAPPPSRFVAPILVISDQSLKIKVLPQCQRELTLVSQLRAKRGAETLLERCRDRFSQLSV